MKATIHDDAPSTGNLAAAYMDTRTPQAHTWESTPQREWQTYEMKATGSYSGAAWPVRPRRRRDSAPKAASRLSAPLLAADQRLGVGFRHVCKGGERAMSYTRRSWDVRPCGYRYGGAGGPARTSRQVCR